MRKLLLLSVAFFIGMQAEAQELLSLKDAITIGLENNFDIMIAEKDSEIAENNVTLGNAGFLPRVDLDFNQNWSRRNSTVVFPPDESDPDADNSRTVPWARADNLGAGANLQWTLFDGLGMFVTYDKLEELREIGLLNAQVTIQNTVANISDVYYLIVLQQATLEVLHQNLEISEQRMRYAESRYEVGKGSKLDYLSAQVDFNEDRTALIVQEQLLNNAKVDLNQLLGRVSDTDFNVEGDFQLNKDLIYGQLQEMIRNQNPELKLAMLEQNVSYLEEKEFRAERYPSIFFDLGYTYSNSSNELAFFRSARSNGVIYGVSARWSVFDGFNKDRRVQNARINQEIQAYERDAVELDLMSSLAKTFENYQTSIELIEIETANQVVALENEQIALDRYELGKGTPLQLREAQRNAVQARIRLLDIQLASKRAEIEMRRLTGTILNVVE